MSGPDREALEDIRTLKAWYFHYLDAKDWAGWRTVFCEDAVFDLSGEFPDAPDPAIHVLTGADAIVRAVSKAVASTVTVHHGHDPILTLEGPDTARGIWSLEDNLFFPDGRRMTGFGHYHESYRRIDGDWKIAHSRVTRLKTVMVPSDHG